MIATQDTHLQDLIPAHLHASPLLAQGGFQVFEGLLTPDYRARMLSEALQQLPQAEDCAVTAPDTEEVRGGTPRRNLLSAPGNAVQDAFYTAGWMLDFLHQVTGVPVQPSGLRGTYSYYARPGDYLALHRDIETCDLAVNTCLYDTGTASDGGGLLHLYPERAFEPLSALRQNPDEGALPLRLLPGQTIVMLGGIVPHEVLPVVGEQVRIMSVLCYRV